MKIKPPLFPPCYNNVQISPFYLQNEMLGMFGSSHVIDLWACSQNDFDKCEP